MSNLENTWLLKLNVRRETIEEIQAKLISLETFGRYVTCQFYAIFTWN